MFYLDLLCSLVIKENQPIRRLQKIKGFFYENDPRNKEILSVLRIRLYKTEIRLLEYNCGIKISWYL